MGRRAEFRIRRSLTHSPVWRVASTALICGAIPRSALFGAERKNWRQTVDALGDGRQRMGWPMSGQFFTEHHGKPDVHPSCRTKTRESKHLR
jgi:hypothetical protein